MREDTQPSPGAPATSEAVSRAPGELAQAEAPASSRAGSLDPDLDRALADALRAPLSAPPGVMIDDKYVVMTLIGEGGMSRVFEAKNHLTGRRVALKWLHGRAGSPGVDPHRLIQEARATARIEHPNVVQVFDLGFVGGQPYLVMELLRGQALDQYLERSGPMPPRQAALLLAPVLDAAQAFHDAGVVHRDLKPANLFMVQDGVNPPYLKVLDFGVASLIPNLGEGEESLSLTQPGMALGTPFYMAPEQLRREKADARSDVFALGCILYEMCTGERPFPAKDFAGLLEILQSEEPADRRERFAATLPDLAPVLSRALASDAKQRFQSAQAFHDALLDVSFNQTSEAELLLERSIDSDAEASKGNVERQQTRGASSSRELTEPASSQRPSTRKRGPRRALTLVAVAALLVLGSVWLNRAHLPGVAVDPGTADRARDRTKTEEPARDGLAPAMDVEISSLQPRAAPAAAAPSDPAASPPAAEQPEPASAGVPATTSSVTHTAAQKKAAPAAGKPSKSHAPALSTGTGQLDESDF